MKKRKFESNDEAMLQQLKRQLKQLKPDIKAQKVPVPVLARYLAPFLSCQELQNCVQAKIVEDADAMWEALCRRENMRIDRGRESKDDHFVLLPLRQRAEKLSQTITKCPGCTVVLCQCKRCAQVSSKCSKCGQEKRANDAAMKAKLQQQLNALKYEAPKSEHTKRIPVAVLAFGLVQFLTFQEARDCISAGVLVDTAKVWEAICLRENARIGKGDHYVKEPVKNRAQKLSLTTTRCPTCQAMWCNCRTCTEVEPSRLECGRCKDRAADRRSGLERQLAELKQAQVVSSTDRTMAHLLKGSRILRI